MASFKVKCQMCGHEQTMSDMGRYTPCEGKVKGADDVERRCGQSAWSVGDSVADAPAAARGRGSAATVKTDS